MLQNNKISQTLESLKKSTFRSKFKLTEKDRQYIRNKGIDTIGCIPYDAEIFEAGLEGHPVQSSTAKQEIGKIIDTLLSDVKTFK